MLLDKLTVNVEGNISNLNSSLSQAQSSIGSFGEQAGAKLKNLGSSMIGVGAKMSLGLTAPLMAVGTMAVRSAADLEQTKIAFTTLLGSAEKAGSYMEELKAFAAKTPFEFPDLATAASRLAAVGTNTKSIIPIMTTLGNATSAMGTGSEGIERAVRALTQMRQKGKVTAEEMMQLTEAGIPAWEALASTLGVTVAKAQEMVTKKQVDANKMFEAIETSAGPGLQKVTGMMDKQSQSLTGLISTLKDTVSMGLASMIEPLIPTIKAFVGWLSKLAAGFAALSPSTKRFILIGAAIAAALGPILVFAGTIISAIGTIAPVIATVVGAISGPIALIIALVVGAAYLIVKNWDKVKAVLAGLWDAVKPAIQPFIDALKWIAMGIGDAFRFGDITYFLDVIGELIGLPLGPWFTAIMNAAKALWQVFTDLVGSIDWQPIIDALMAIWNTIVSIVTPVFEFLKGVVKDAMAFMMATMGVIIAWVQANWPLIKSTIQTVVNVISTVIKTALTVIKAVWMAVWPYLQIVLTTVWNVIKTVVSTAINVILGIIKTVMLIIKGDWKGAWESIKGVVGTILNGAVKVISTILSGLANIVSTALKGAWNAVKSWVGKFADAARDLIQGMVRAVKDKVGDIGDAIVSGLKGAIKWVKKLLGIGSPSKVFYAFGENLMESMAKAIVKTAPEVKSALNGLDLAIPSAASVAGVGLVGVPSTTTYGDTYVTVEAQLSGDMDIDYLAERLNRRLIEERRAGGQR